MDADNRVRSQMSVKNLERMALKAKQAHSVSEAKAKAALAAGNIQAARVHAESAIRQKAEAMHYLQLAAQVESSNSRMATAVAGQQAMGHIADATNMLEQALPPGEADRVAQTLDAFNAKSEQMDMSERYMNNAMEEASSMSTPLDQVDDLVRRIAAEHHIDTTSVLPNAPLMQQPGAYGLQQQHYTQPGQAHARTAYGGLAPPR